ncbi:ABC transporter substrate-binding protein [Ectothiorhodospira lacustris]|uniref:ABC transporter substrate-binding protein n=1 Tax=Ectothiorhodospira lacustris TaxID=2899127 RepID=UPI001EE86920|nr:ABC transporter substrate-binding protein [Ectothiorhodospira lacustris]MCG5502067.1 ABC transporter substrate-binding protein [Ectothiorhodospira lacustris]MCG5508929.1 ABC transporter substrate-binding protein [Ectothiorhodospira lacustris]MCG5520720.1 ABC transporter substrate-binding protein [Ectothiorhodospira lacustris]
MVTKNRCPYRAVLLIVLLVCGMMTPAMAAEPIRIGALVSATGPASFLGDPELKTLELYVERINAAGGVIGRPLRLFHYDDGGNANEARNFANRLLRSDRVDLIIGGSTTGTTMAAVPLVERAGRPIISMAGALVITEPVRPWVFKTPQSDRMAAERVLADMQGRGITGIGLISGTDGFGRSGREQTLAVAADFGIQVLADQTYGPQDTDMTAQLTRIRNTPGVQAVFNFGFGQGPAIVTRNYAHLGIELPFYQSHGVASDRFLDLAGSAAEGVRLPASALLVPDALPDDDPQKQVVQDYKAAYEARWNMSVSTFGGYAYDALMLAVAAIEAAGTTDPDAVRSALEQIRDHVGVTGTFNMSADDHNGLAPESFRLLEVRDGQWVLVD